ncbi:DUF2273 domain-containing protein [Candidatus Contubernalis alkaliaceticus]|uniref:DUF2273 domain-containing protein n=1 Tax=Candidatus Contubernalis alkaliaceticus TaxID=338645 RepID=UPI001F4BFC5C|nr:DUF2273 domain-containing protein [Candidatus Contubernalis alkalaceticus]UNC92548.1 DUF2273 domain-containing protein [Candidatus Contubernalis alkalaceticus]
MKNVRWNELLIENMGKILGAVAGLILGFIFLRFGFLKGSFIMVCMVLGIYLGAVMEKSHNWENFLENLWPPNKHDW